MDLNPLGGVQDPLHQAQRRVVVTPPNRLLPSHLSASPSLLLTSPLGTLVLKKTQRKQALLGMLRRWTESISGAS